MARSCLCLTWLWETWPAGLITRWEDSQKSYQEQIKLVIDWLIFLILQKGLQTAAVCVFSWCWTLRSACSPGALAAMGASVTPSRRMRWFPGWSSCLTFLAVVPVRSMQATNVRLLSARWVCHIATRSLNSLAQVGCTNVDTVSFHRFLFNLDVQESEVIWHAELPTSPFHQQFRQTEF